MKKFGLLDKIPLSFRKKNGMNDGNEKNSTATGGEEDEEEQADVGLGELGQK